MKGEGGEALDVALDLLRTPGLRAALRAHALPPGIGEVLAIAAGSTDTLRQARARTGYGDAELVEAARFYVQQVLLIDGMDAYRTLGAGRDAEQSLLRDHHRLLLRWLHPDRSGEQQWDSALATRVNQAWNQLRNADARAQYNASREALGIDSMPVAMPVRPQRPAALHVGPSTGSRAAPIAVTLLGLACLILAWLAIQREDPVDEPPSPSAHATSVEAGNPATVQPATPESAEVAPVLPSSRVEARIVDAPPHAIALPAAAIALPVAAPARVTDRPAVDRMPLPAPTPAPTPARIARLPDARAVLPPAPKAFAPSGALPQSRAGAAAAAPEPEATLAMTTTPEPPAAPADPLRLLREAEADVASVVAYLNGFVDATPPWRDADIRRRGAHLRRALHARNGQPEARLRLETPNWTLDTHAASVHAAYRLSAEGRVLESGVAYVQLVRREPGWQVSALQVEAVQ